MRLLSLLAAVLLAALGGENQPTVRGARALFSFQDPAIVESSGLALAGPFFVTHNDSGDTPRFFVVDGDGCTVGRFEVAGARAVDWEDMSARGGRLFFGDIGDNTARRTNVVVYEAAAPSPEGLTCAEPRDGTVPGTARVLTYEDGPRDAEGLAVHPIDGSVYVVTKTLLADAVLYRADGGVLRRVAALPVRLVTGAAFSPDGTKLVVRTYSAAYVFRTADYAATPTKVDLPSQPQGESVTFTAGGDALIVTSEDPLRSRPPVWLVPLQ